jgi:hypothetical protein
MKGKSRAVCNSLDRIWYYVFLLSVGTDEVKFLHAWDMF